MSSDKLLFILLRSTFFKYFIIGNRTCQNQPENDFLAHWRETSLSRNSSQQNGVCGVFSDRGHRFGRARRYRGRQTSVRADSQAQMGELLCLSGKKNCWRLGYSCRISRYYTSVFIINSTRTSFSWISSPSSNKSCLEQKLHAKQPKFVCASAQFAPGLCVAYQQIVPATQMHAD